MKSLKSAHIKQVNSSNIPITIQWNISYLKRTLVFLSFLCLYFCSAANIDRINEKLFMACITGNLPTVKDALKNGADINFTDKETTLTPLGIALLNSRFDIAKFLISEGASVNIIDNSGCSLLSYSDDEDIFNILLSKGLTLTQKDKYGRLPIHKIAGLNQLNNMSAIIKRKFDINIKDSSGMTPMHWACRNSNEKMAKLLFQYGGKLNVKDKGGITPLHYACIKENPQLIEWLISNGAKVNVKDLEGNTPLHYAGILKATGNIEILLKNGADKSIQNNAGQTYIDATL